MTEKNTNTDLPVVLTTPLLALAPTVLAPEEKPLDRVKQQTEKKRQRERER